MTFFMLILFCFFSFFWLLKMPRMLQLFLVQELHKRQATHCGFTAGAEKDQLTTSVDIVPYIFFLLFFFFTSMPEELGVISCSDWVFETKLQCLSCDI